MRKTFYNSALIFFAMKIATEARMALNTNTHTRGLHGLKTEARTRPVPEIVWPDPSGTVKFRARNHPPPPRATTNNTKKRKKVAFHDCMQRNGLIKALPFHKHLPVMKVCEHQVQRSHTFCRVYAFVWTRRWWPCKLWSFLSVKAR